MKTYVRALTIAGSDSGGGAGIQADLKTFSALGCFGMSVVTALTAQNTEAVTGIYGVPPEFTALQMDAVLSDIGADAVKIGMLNSPEIIEIVAERLKSHNCRNIVLDPVMVAKSGDKLLEDDAVHALKESLIPMADIITPNLPEASVLLGRPVEKLEQMADACRELALLGCENILLKGGHLTGQGSVDFLYITAMGSPGGLSLHTTNDESYIPGLPGLSYKAQGDELQKFDMERINTVNSHGTGCTLSSAVAAHLALGHDINSAVKKAKEYITNALIAGVPYKTGNGHGPVHHFHEFWE
ncbi:MAG: bifunctional hydroxymethylpyrimidine kinase/phosphomethylpyrimidine kinase [Thermodesulfobacteriota bacterium]|nr:bifunctional hydroxymethylpyrimidine kinase/phosphomethylpyrimidine kinase [Thermodesulfobacteriota bacterium]